MQPMGPAPANAPARRKLHPLVWVLIGLIGLILLLAVAAAAVGFYVAQRFEENPAAATAALLSTLNTGLEVVSSDKAGGTITLRDKNTGKTVTLDLNDLKSTSFNVGTGGKEITLVAGGRKLVLGGAKPPDWVPAYENASVKGSISSEGPDGIAGSQTFETGDGASKVLEFYEQELPKAGLRVTRESGTKLVAKSDRREVSVDASMEGDGSRVILSYTAKE